VVNTVDLTLKNINELRLLGRIQEEVRNINTANNNYPLSNTQKLLRDLIDQQDSPFIYEKIGGQLRYIMIDEFQDTSTVQWDNFKILLDDCLAHNAGSLIVGDVKQSIYRWRNGDWRLLQQLSTSEDIRIGVKTLDTNYRSQANIILFNNEFFEKASALTTSQAIADIGTDASATLKQEAETSAMTYIDVAQKDSAAKRPSMQEGL
jgi:ATP-dependent exoDNAse (exonuclease V) beta subunit